MSPVLEVLLPVHNEADSIEHTIREIHAELSPGLTLGFIVCEDGSLDETKNVLRRLSLSLPMKLILSEQRKGYSRAVIDGMSQLSSPYLLCLDSDGQCDPRDFWRLWGLRNDCDVVIGWRVHRADNLLRKLMSRTFYRVYRLLYSVPVHDPSCPFVLIRRDVAQRLVPELGLMQQGFWWEFVARSHRRGYSIKEVAVHHRSRAAGVTQVYKLRKLPRIGWTHFLALFKIWSQTRGG